MTTPKCDFTGTTADYQICTTLYNKRTPHQVVGFVCADKVEQAIEHITKEAFATPLWPTVHDLSGKLLYHSYDADQKGLSAVVGWEEYLREQGITRY